MIHPGAASGLLTFRLPLLILLLEVLDSPLELPVIFSKAMNVSEDHVFDIGEIVGVLDTVHLFLKLPVGQIGHIVNVCSVFLGGEVESVTEILVLNGQLEVSLHRVFVLL